MKKAKEIKLELIKTNTGYTVANEADGVITMAGDDDEGRKAIINVLVNEFFNAEVQGGRKYK